MAKKITDKLEPTKNTKEEIEAALAKASGGQFVKEQTNAEPVKSKIEQIFDRVERNAPKINAKLGEDPYELNSPCDIEIDAKDCFKISNEHPDKSIQNYICGINSKIKNETINGGYSTNVTIRVVPNQWVNVQHIVDWYRVKGFTVSVDEARHPQYGVGAGSMEYNIGISWVNAH